MKIRTVLGDISPSELGVTACHEHLIWSVPEPYADEDPDLGFDSIPAAVAEARYFKLAGGDALVEMTTAEIGRCPVEMRQIAEASGLRVIAATGHHKEKFSAAALAGKSADEIADGIVTDIASGMSGTDIKAGVIKAASSLNAATESERRVIHAVGLAHKATGAPVSTHTEAGTFAVEQAKLLNEAGVPFERMLIGHLDRGLPRETYLELARLGVFLGFDQVGKNKYWLDSERVLLIKDLIAAGYVNQILLSGDTARKSAWHVYNPRTNGLAQILLDFIPSLRSAGVSESRIQSMLVENPARFLAF
ncbi:MAG: phosphotriesterase-related protein [Chloroflexi bacterium]|nr:phosphotriesterase-related protein [Chloroflexota bacterium]MCA2001344.1 phosphotriesterase-related protein [Chloroflexota bacterium]